jgi:hypothetical protein
MALVEFIYEHEFLSSIALVLILAYTYHIILVTPGPSEPPLIKGYLPFFGTLPQLLLNPSVFLTACKRDYGDIFTLYAIGQRVTIITDPIQGIPAVFKKSKQLSFKAGLRRLYLRVLGYTAERADEEEMNREHFQMIPPHLLSKPAVDELTGRFIGELLIELRRQVTTEVAKTGMLVDLFDWMGERLFMASGPALWGEGLFDGAKTVVEDYKIFDDGFPKRLILPLWMSKGLKGLGIEFKMCSARSSKRD